MANVNIWSGLLSGGATKRASRNIVFTSAAIGYAFANVAAGFVYRKTSDGGATWSANVIINATLGLAYDVWFDQWTPGDTGTLIHTWYFDTTNNKVFWRSLDTNGDTLGTERTAFTGVSAVAGRGAFCSGTKSRSGYLYCVFDLDAGAERALVQSTDIGTTWNNIVGGANFCEATIDECLLFPATGTGDNNDFWAIYQDASADALTMKLWDDSASAPVESSTMQTMVENVTDGTGQRGFTGSVRQSDGHLIVVSCSERDTATADMQVWDVSAVNSGSLTGITSKTDITTNIDDNYNPAICIDQDTDTIYVAYNGKRDGSETLGTTTKIYYTKSTDGGATWTAGDTALDEGTATTNFQVWGPLSGHRFTAVWLTGSSLITNKVNSVVLYTLVAARGTFTETGQDVTLKVSMPADQGSFTLSGQSVTLTYTPAGGSATITAAVGSFTLTGEASSFAVAHKLDLNPVVADSYSESNQSGTGVSLSSTNSGLGQTFTAIAGPLDSAVFYLKKNGSPTGNAVAKLYTITGTIGVDAIPTVPALATSDNFDISTLTTSYALITFQFSGANRYLMTGGAHYFITIEYGGGGGGNQLVVAQDITSPTHSGIYSTFSGGTWQFALTNFDVCFYVYAAQGQGSFTLGGQSVTLAVSMAADFGSFSDSGQTANLLAGRKLAAGFASFTDTGQTANLLAGHKLAIGQGSFTLAGQDASLIYAPIGAFTIAANRGTFTLSGQAALLERGRFVAVSAGLFTESGQSVSFRLGKALAALQGTFILLGQDAELTFAGILGIHPAAGEFALTGQSIFFSFNYALLILDFDAPTRSEAQFNGAGEAGSQFSVAGAARSSLGVGKAKSNLTADSIA